MSASKESRILASPELSLMRASLASEKVRGTPQGCFRMGLAISLDSTEINSVAISEKCQTIIGCAFEVLNELGTGFREIILYILSIHVHLFCSTTYA